MATNSNSRVLVILLLTSGFFISGLLFDYMPLLVDNQIKRTVELATNEEIRTLWSNPPVDFHSYYWLYDILNPEQFIAGEKIRVRKVGPYHFTSRIEKRIIELSKNKHRLIYNSTRHMYVNESDVITSLDEPLCLLNPIYASLMEATRENSGRLEGQQRTMVVSSANRLAERFNESLFLNITPRTAFLGRKVVMIEKARRMIETFGIEQKLPDIMNTDWFGFVSVINGTWSGPFEIYTGYQATMPSLGDIISYKGKKRLTEYQGKCNRLQTSAGELRPMPIGVNQVLEMFMPNFCRIIHLIPTGVRKMREGLSIGYIISPDDLLSADSNPDNRCYCVNGTTDNYCSLNGALELGPCSYYSPIVVTVSGIEPDKRIKDSVEDWDPELLNSDVELVPPADNTSQLLLLKRIGVPLRADITLTLFMKVTRDSHFRYTASVPEVSYIPLMMVREIGSIPPKWVNIVVNLESFLALSQHIKVIMYLSAVVLLCWLAGHYYGKSTRDRVFPSGTNSKGGGRNGNNNAPPDSCASDRVNSADSNRSQPPSRISHSSLDAGSASGESQQQQQQGGEASGGGGRGGANGSGANSRGKRSTAAAPEAGATATASMNSNRADADLSPSAKFGGSRSRTNGADQSSIRQQQQQQQFDSRRFPRGQTGGKLPALEEQTAIGDGRQTMGAVTRSSRIFSKVDEEYRRRSIAAHPIMTSPFESKERANEAQQTAAAAAAPPPPPPNQSQNGASISESGNENDKGTQAGGFGNFNGGDSDQQVGGGGDSQLGGEGGEDLSLNELGTKGDQQQRVRKNWFLKVYSNFVRMLNGIRSSINDAGQLDISENDYQDKQLEMLAGKIDNWYSGNEAAAAAAAAAATNEGDAFGTGTTSGESTVTETRAAAAAAAVASPGSVMTTTTTATKMIPNERHTAGGEQQASAKDGDLNDSEKPTEASQRQKGQTTVKLTTTLAATGDDESKQKQQQQQQQMEQKEPSSAKLMPQADENSRKPDEQQRGPPVKGLAPKGATNDVAGGREEGGSGSKLVTRAKVELPAVKEATTRTTSQQIDDDAGQLLVAATATEEEEEKEKEKAEKKQTENRLFSMDGKGEQQQQQQQQPASAASNASKRIESGQSNRTVINKSDTSGDESVVSSTEDKAKALEQLELNLGSKQQQKAAVTSEKQTVASESGQQTSDDDEQDDQTDSSIDKSGKVGGAKKAFMVSSSTSIDSTFDRMTAAAAAAAAAAAVVDTEAVVAGLTNGFGNGKSNGGSEGGGGGGGGGGAQTNGIASRKSSSKKFGGAQADQWASNQSAKLNDQIDDQSNELAANGVGDNDGHELQCNGIGGKAKDERRDSGYIRFT